MSQTIYLSGPISGCTYKEATEWRQEAARSLVPFRCLDPMRGKTEAMLIGVLDTDLSWADHILSPLTRPRNFYNRDFNDIKQSNLMLMNLQGAKKVSIGSMVEVGWASALGIPIVAVLDFTKSNHDFIYQASVDFFETLDKAVEFIKDFLPGYSDVNYSNPWMDRLDQARADQARGFGVVGGLF